MKRRWKLAAWLVTLAALGGGGAYGVRQLRTLEAAATIPTAAVREGEFLEMVTCRGELVANRSVQILAPMNVPDLRIVWLAPDAAAVKEGDIVIRFDASTAKQQLAERQAALNQTQAALDQAIAQAKITAEQDKRDLVAAKHEVERARLEVSKAEIVSRLKGEEAKVNLGLAEDKLRVQEATIDLHTASDAARVASMTRVRDRSKEEVGVTERRLARMEVKSPGNGIIVYLSNYSQGWMNAKPFRVGDRAWGGSAIAEIPDLTTIQMKGKLEEIDRGRIAIGAETRVSVDALPEKPLKAQLSLISPLTEQNFEWPPTRNFRALAGLVETDQRLRPGMNGRMDIVVKRHSGALTIPSKAIFSRQGKAIAYVAEGGRFRAVFIEIIARNTDESAVKGLRPGQHVSLVEVAADRVIS